MIRCENKIALARQFYNESVERLNNRVGTIPDMFVASLASAQEEDFLEFDDFEKKPVEVDFDDDADGEAGVTSAPEETEPAST